MTRHPSHVSVALALLPLAILGMATRAGATVSVPTLFSDGMVLQRDRWVPFWGSGAEGEQVEVRYRGLSVHATTRDGRWIAWLPPLPEHGSELLEIEGSNLIQLQNVRVGEVWLCAGQSNMWWPVSWADGDSDAIQAAANDDIHLYQLPLTPDASGTTWQASDPTNVQAFSAVGYHFGRHLGPAISGPIGLIQAAVPTTAIDLWSNDVGAGVIFNQKIAPLIPFAIRGVLWYQGESDAATPGLAQAYEGNLRTLITEWRREWARTDMPFLIVQLADGPFPESPVVRDAQRRVLDVPETALVVTIDLPEDGLHPRAKPPVGERLALAARRLVHEEPVVHVGPLIHDAGVIGRGSELIVPYQLAAGGLTTTDGNPPRAFEIASGTGPWIPADAQISGETVVLSSPGVSQPTRVRYAFEPAPETVNLTDSSALPAVAFGPLTAWRSACDDGLDNDGDGWVDLADPGCPSSEADREDPACDNGIDDDLDGTVDFADTDCDPSWPYLETRACGLGFELAPLLGLLALVSARRARDRSATPAIRPGAAPLVASTPQL